ncbi:MAG: recombination protein RecR [Candidatus Makaraimicrobium thalassicum]|nr:MAG: recombination protein RecR [Candidatus Omnitrophota bacterium]
MERLIDAFSRMPGIGVRSAQRLTFYILQSSGEEVNSLLRRIGEVKENIRFCEECNNLSEKEVCSICSDRTRDTSKLCVVEGPSGVIAMEKSGAYRGLYHVLLGELSPIDGVGPEELKIRELVQRVKKGHVKEVIIATDFTTEGETTALYLFEVLKPFKVKISRLARGVPVGSSLEHADIATLQRAFEERRGV